MVKAFFEWIIHTDLALIVAICGLGVTFWQTYQNQERIHKEEMQTRSRENKKAADERQELREDIKIIYERINQKNIELRQMQANINILLEWMSRFTFSDFGKK